MKVAELRAKIAERQEERHVVKLGEIQIADDASSIMLGPEPGAAQYYLDDHATRMLGRYLKIPRPYLLGLPPQFRANLLRFHRDQHPEAETVVETLGDSLVSVHAPHLLMIPLERVADIVTRLVSDQAEVRTFLRDEKIFHLDVTDPRYSVAVPAGDGQETIFGGVRIVVCPNEVRPPVVVTYVHHEPTGGAMVTDMDAGRIKLKGRSLDEVLDEIECQAETVLAGLDERLAAFAATRDIEVPGTALAFATRLLREASMPVRVRDAVGALVNQLASDATVYDVTCAIASVASRINYGTAMRLQQLCGQLAFNAEQTVRRCSQCEQLLVVV